MTWSEQYKRSIRLCGGCMKMCHVVCPTSITPGSETFSPYGRSLLMHLVLQGKIPYNKEVAEVIYKCTVCAHCKEYCRADVDFPSIVKAARRDALERGVAPTATLTMQKRINQTGNPYGFKLQDRFSQYTNLTRSTNPNADVLLFIGCSAAYNHPSIVRSTSQIIQTLGESFRVMEDEWCCGSPLIRTGFVDISKQLAIDNKEKIEGMGIDHLITVCPGCYHTFKQDYGELGVRLGVKISHISSYLAERIEHIKYNSLKLKDIKVTYHDPCHLGRYSGIYEEPRKIIESVPNVELVEMQWNKEMATCCGSGGGLVLNYPNLASDIARITINNALATGANYLVTACPFCKSALTQAAEREGDIRVVDLSEFVARFLR